MSYSRSYSETVYKVVSKTVRYDYPASERGGSSSIYVEIEAEIPVDVNIHVDTNPFDNSVNHCGNNVDLLTTAVIATESAEIISKELNSKKVANTIIGGFFGYIRSEISQQIAELSQKVDAQTIHLKELMQSCISKAKQMEGDFHRISSRYVKIFEDLNNELSNRIYELDKPAFIFKKDTDSQKIRTSENDLVNTISTFGIESSNLNSQITSSIVKKRALDTIYKSKLFLWQQKKLNTTIQQSMLNENVACSMYVPVCFIETINVNNQISKGVFSANYISFLSSKSQINDLLEKFSKPNFGWYNLEQEEQKKMSLYLNTELNTKLNDNDPHSLRVREMIQKIVNFNSIKAINIKQN